MGLPACSCRCPLSLTNAAPQAPRPSNSTATAPRLPTWQLELAQRGGHGVCGLPRLSRHAAMGEEHHRHAGAHKVGATWRRADLARHCRRRGRERHRFDWLAVQAGGQEVKRVHTPPLATGAPLLLLASHSHSQRHRPAFARSQQRTCTAAHNTSRPELVAFHPRPHDAAGRVPLSKAVELLALLALQKSREIRSGSKLNRRMHDLVDWVRQEHNTAPSS